MFSERTLIVAFRFLYFSRAANFFDIISIYRSDCRSLNQFRNVFPSRKKTNKSPFCQRFILLSNATRWSLAFEFFEVFCNNKLGIIISTLNNAVPSMQLFPCLTVFSINDLSALSDYNKDNFFFQCTIFTYICCTLSVISFPSNSPR